MVLPLTRKSRMDPKAMEEKALEGRTPTRVRINGRAMAEFLVHPRKRVSL